MFLIIDYSFNYPCGDIVHSLLSHKYLFYCYIDDTSSYVACIYREIVVSIYGTLVN